MVRAWLVVMILIGAGSPDVDAAQADASGVAGVIRDSSGAAIPGVTIHIVNEATSASLDAVSDAQGAFAETQLAPGAYRVHATLDGFDPGVRRIAVDAGHSTALELTLSPSRLTESVVVTARRVEEEAQEVPIPLSVLSGRPARPAKARSTTM